MISLTIFKNKYDTDITNRVDLSSFDKFEGLLYRLSKRKIRDKASSQLISPATYQPLTSRKNVNVVNWAGWAALDVDTYPAENFKEAILERFGKYRFICYSTPTSSIEQPKFRLVFELNGNLEAEKIRSFWFSLNTLADSMGDKQTKDLSRMYYIPGDYSTSTNQFIFSNPGEPIDPDQLIRDYPPPIKENATFFDKLPEDIQKQIVEYRKGKMDNTTFSWTSYRDCPFWPKKLEQEYRAITGSGWYHKMYQIMVAIAGRALDKKYPITPTEIAQLCHEFDNETGGWYKDRPLETEADRALEFVYKHIVI